ncbi:TPA: restriction endonuclease [Vibrio parahaemolyticus]|uniref:restriction endonuclease n=1 Tax=Vibrio parahaemolyticus TaxID=670 RepID=UPI000317B3D8|nr:restriction endonuclease [Vibrio parahaemolyticus]EGQ9244664.1 restriction endonuclease [Vibrio parahaemolyticus]EGR1344668.1 hypothetical protein [Vibrio parahaemolyticus]EGR1899291.1 hypothetical protein [Vibrio parahaemolyticus]EGR1922123.1 hypothetical protein [Vibrio parahaemolyticus]EGR3399532.1 hypothetical protein [Vibrio parahaemolyticus]
MSTKYGTSVLDFSELDLNGSRTREKRGDRFEKFAEEFLELQGYEVVKRPAIGTDGGCDLIVQLPKRREQKRATRYLVSCKNYSRPINRKNDEFNLSLLDRHKCDSFVLFYSNDVTSDMLEHISAIDEDCAVYIDRYSGADIEKIMLEMPAYYGLMRRYFPKCYNSFIRQRKGVDCEYVDCSGYDCDDYFVQFIYEPKNFGMEDKITCRHCATDLARDLHEDGIPYDSFRFYDE